MNVTLLSSALVFFALLLALEPLRDIWDALSEKYLGHLVEKFEAVGFQKRQLDVWLRFWGVLILGTIVAFLIVIKSVPLFSCAMFLVLISPRMIVEWLVVRRRAKLRDQLVIAARTLANAFRAGKYEVEGLRLVSREIEDPLKSEIRTIVTDSDRGLALPVAINRAKERLKLDSFSLFANALNASLETGGETQIAMENISRSLEEDQKVERKLETETAAGKKQIKFLAAFPIFFLALFAAIYQEATIRVFQTVGGQVILMIVVGLIFLTLVWGQKIYTIEK